MKEIVCIVCPNGCRIQCTKAAGDEESAYTFRGNRCKRGIDYAKAELTKPMRTLTTSVRTIFSECPVVSVRTNGEIDKNRIFDVVGALSSVVVDTRIGIGDVIVPNICDTGVDIVCTTNRLKRM